MAQVNVTINGKTYRMACDDGQEDHLLGLAAQLNRTIATLRASFGEIGDQRLTVMAAITMADQSAEAERRVRALEEELAALKTGEADALRRQEVAEAGVADAIIRAADRIHRAAARLEANDD